MIELPASFAFLTCFHCPQYLDLQPGAPAGKEEPSCKSHQAFLFFSLIFFHPLLCRVSTPYVPRPAGSNAMLVTSRAGSRHMDIWPENVDGLAVKG